MSIDYGIYAGPYVCCVVRRVPVTKLHITCPNTECKNHGRDMRSAYCDLCGGKCATLSYVELEDAVDHWDVSEAIDERLSSASGDAYARWSEENRVHLWTPNKPIQLVAGHLDAREAFALHIIGPSTIEDEIARFKATFQKDIEYLESVYGADAVSFHWGIIQDYT